MKTMKELQRDLFGEPVVEDVLLRNKYIEPPFSVLDAKSGQWQDRKRSWISKGIKSEAGRDVEIIRQFDPEKYKGVNLPKESIFDPVLCEIMYTWFCRPNGKILDPFAGGSVRGIVANYLGFKYTGIDLREEQITSNIQQATEIFKDDPENIPKWAIGDSDVLLDNPELFEYKYDMMFTCPPYYDLEVYSNLKGDLSNMSDKNFDIKYESIIRKACKYLRTDAYAIFVVGDVRDSKTGHYKDLIGLTKSAFKKAGFGLYNYCILLNSLGTAAIRSGKVFESDKKLTKVHQDILIFRK